MTQDHPLTFTKSMHHLPKTLDQSPNKMHYTRIISYLNCTVTFNSQAEPCLFLILKKNVVNVPRGSPSKDLKGLLTKFCIQSRERAIK